MGRLNSKYYRYRAEQNALNNVAPRTSGGGIFSRRYDKPAKPSSGGIVGMMRRRDEVHWSRDQRHMQRSDYAKRAVDFERRNPKGSGLTYRETHSFDTGKFHGPLYQENTGKWHGPQKHFGRRHK